MIVQDGVRASFMMQARKITWIRVIEAEERAVRSREQTIEIILDALGRVTIVIPFRVIHFWRNAAWRSGPTEICRFHPT